MATCDHDFVAPTLVSSDQVEPLSEEVHKCPLKTAATILLPSADIAMEYQLLLEPTVASSTQELPPSVLLQILPERTTAAMTDPSADMAMDFQS